MDKSQRQKFLGSSNYQDLLLECPILENHFNFKTKKRFSVKNIQDERELLIDLSDNDLIVINTKDQEYKTSRKSLERILSQVPSDFSIYSVKEIRLILSLSRKSQRNIDSYSIASKHLPLWLGILTKTKSKYLHEKCEESYLLHGVPGIGTDAKYAFAKKHNFNRIKLALIAMLKQKFQDADFDEQDFKAWSLLEKGTRDNFFSCTWDKNFERYKNDPNYLNICWTNAKKYKIEILKDKIKQFVPGNEKFITNAFLVTPLELKALLPDINIEVQ